jgi:putative ABC transport system permease protein
VPFIRQNIVTPDFFNVLGIQLRGRPFTDQETWETGGVVVVNEAFAQRYFPGTDPLGKRIKIREDQPWLTIVGVSRNVLQDVSNSKVFEEVINPYRDPTDPFPVLTMSLVIRTNVDPKSVLTSVREEVRRLDPELPLSKVLTMQEIVDRVSAAPRFNMFLFTLFGAIALILAAVGIYGVISQMVTQQTHEIGVRMALGARSADVMRFVLRRGMVLTLLGVVIGLAGSILLTRLMVGLFYGVIRGIDLLTYGGFSLVLLATAFFACYIPARRAVGIDPVIALRHE